MASLSASGISRSNESDQCGNVLFVLIIIILFIVLDFVRLFRGVMMGVLSDKLFETNSCGAAICLKNAKCFVQHLSNPSEADSRFTNKIVPV